MSDEEGSRVVGRTTNRHESDPRRGRGKSEGNGDGC